MQYSGLWIEIYIIHNTKINLISGSYRPIDPLHRIWKDGAPSRKMIAMAPNTLFGKRM